MSTSLESALGYTFQDTSLLDLSLTHSSVGHEQRNPIPHNERLEFLGDAVIQLAVSEYLYRTRTATDEGDLTKMRAHLVSRAAMAEMARSLGLGEHLRLGKSEEIQGGRCRPSNLSNAMEAVIGAVFLDSNFETARDVIIRHIRKRLDEIDENPEPRNAKGALQELLHRLAKVAIYKIVSETGPAHRKEFQATVEIDGKVCGRGSGSTKKEAETKAALEALPLFRRKKEM